MTDQQQRDEVRRTLDAWEVARREAEAVRRQFVASGPLDASGRIPMPPRVLDVEGMRELAAAEEKEKAAWDAHQQAIGGWRSSRR